MPKLSPTQARAAAAYVAEVNSMLFPRCGYRISADRAEVMRAAGYSAADAVDALDSETSGE